MDFADIARRAAAAREFTHTINAAQFTLRLPTRHEATVALLRASGGGDFAAAAMVEFRRALLAAGIVGWGGIVVGDIVPGGGDESLPWAAAAVPLLLDNRPDYADALGEVYMARMAERTSATEAAEKN
ncbi:MAG: hypothetical protein ACK52I_31535 [Pseudomonadota bacterium]|jgi:hypothetical protein